jgi:cell wall-associated NlpC family hydrolase
MDKMEFIKKVTGAPWIDKGCDFDGMDCHGLVCLYFKHVLGIEITMTPKGSGATQPERWMNEELTGNWEKIDKPEKDGVVMTCYSGGAPSHVGVIISATKVLHSFGTKDNPGGVRVTSIEAIRRTYGRVTFHKMKEKACSH